MSIIVMSQSLYIGSFGMEQVSYDMMESSDATGAEAVRIFGPPRWKVGMGAGENMTLAQASLWEVLVLQLKRGVNCLGVWDPVRPLPQGTMRGTPQLSASAAAGANAVNLVGATGSLNAGDWLQIGTGVGTSQFVKVTTPVTGTGTVTATFEPALRIGFPSGTQVLLDHPVFYARNVNKSVRWDYQQGNLLVNGFSLDLLETFS